MTTEDDDQKGYTWEAGYADGLNIREVLEEDEGGSIEKSIAKLVAQARKSSEHWRNRRKFGWALCGTFMLPSTAHEQ